MIKAILGALESNKYVTLTFSINGGQVQIVQRQGSEYAASQFADLRR